MQRSALCRSRRELSNAYLLAKIGVDTAENVPLEVWGENSIQYLLHSLLNSASRNFQREQLREADEIGATTEEEEFWAARKIHEISGQSSIVAVYSGRSCVEAACLLAKTKSKHEASLAVLKVGPCSSAAL